MVSFEEKAKIEKAGNLNQGHSYVITTVILYLCGSKKIQNYEHIIYGCPLAGRKAGASRDCKIYFQMQAYT